jgi:S-methyl-5-thioribose-1-phosphate isomerase
MRVNIKGEIQEVRTLWREGRIVRMIDQRKLPHWFEITETNHHSETAEAIRNMVLRGAGAIGVAGAYGMAQAALEARDLPADKFNAYLIAAAECLRGTRPTAANLFHSIDRCLRAGRSGSVQELVGNITLEADAIAREDLDASRKIGELGATLIGDSSGVLTHCNAGALAFIDYGTALSPIRFAYSQGKEVFVFVDETRPRCQGSRLTAWELQQEGIPYAVIVDNAAGYFIKRGDVDLVIVGADRIAANGDVANKIGTYEKAVLAHENGVPFYVAAPRMTFDLKCMTGDDITIEERSHEEVLGMWGINNNGESSRIRIAEECTPVMNPAFDVTPAKYVASFITEVGIIRPPYSESIPRAFGSRK